MWRKPIWLNRLLLLNPVEYLRKQGFNRSLEKSHPVNNEVIITSSAKPQGSVWLPRFDWLLCKQCKPVQVLQFRLLGQYPKPIEFFKLHFEEATPSAKNE